MGGGGRVQSLHFSILVIDLFIKTLLKTALVRRLWYSDFCIVSSYQEPANHSITSSLNWLPVLYIVNAIESKVPAQIGQVCTVPMA